jgi:hypothetical protein
MSRTTKTFASPLMQFVVDHLRAVKDAPYKEIAEAAAKKGLKLVPIVYGRARAALGMAKKAKPATTKRGPGRPKGSKNKVGGRGPGRPKGAGRGPGRPASAAAPGSMDAVIAYVRGLERDVADLRVRLAEIASLATE